MRVRLGSRTPVHRAIGFIACILVIVQFPIFDILSANDLTWYVSTTGNDETGDGSIANPFQTIQKGIDTATRFDTVQVAAGVYDENVQLKLSVYVRGSGYEYSIIRGNESVVVGANGSTIEGFMILSDGNGLSWGYITSGSTTTIRNNVFKGHYVGVHCGESGGEVIVNNVVIDNTTGIAFGWDASPTIRNNIIVNNNVHWYNNTQQNFKPNADLAYNNVWNGIYDFSPSPATGNITADPQFGNAAENDFRLWLESPCIDTGDPDAVYKDVDGTRNDMGVYGGSGGSTYDYALPVELISFEADQNDDIIALTWTTATETNNFGFEIERKARENAFRKIGFVKGYGSTIEAQRYTFTDSLLQSGTYLYRLKQLDIDGTYTYSHSVTVNIAVPTAFTLQQNYPNPFNPSTTISYELPESGVVRLSVYNLLGKLIETLIDEHREAGYHNFTWYPDDISDGVYYYRLSYGDVSLVRKAIFVK